MTRPLLEWLLERFPDTPKKRAKQWILAGRVRVGGQVIRKPNQPLPDPGDSLQMIGRHEIALVFEPEWQVHAALSVLHLDSSLAVVNKAPGLLSVPAPLNELCALSILADLMSGKLRTRERQSLPPIFRNLKPRPVHRLDLFTSGLLCFALNPKARANLIEQFSAHTATREYIAFVDGRPKTPRGTWRHWLQLIDDGLRQRVLSQHEVKTARPAPMEAITHYEVTEEYTFHGHPITKLRLWLQTGRRHQVRVQAAQEGLPLIGDRTYHPGYKQAHEKDMGTRQALPIEFPRQALHATLLSLVHPERPGKQMTWTADLPEDLRRLEQMLKRKL